VRRLVLQLRVGATAPTRASAAAALASIAELPGLRRHGAQSQAPALAVISGYSAATAGLFPVNDGIADLSGNSALIASVRALGSLSRMKDQASQRQAILDAALAQGHFEPGALTALTIAQAQQASDLVSFRSSATPEESWALTETLAGPLPGQARAVEQRATAVGNGALALGPHASQQVAGRHVLHGRLDAPCRAAAGGLDHGLRPDPAAERDALRDSHRGRGAGRPGPCLAGHHDHCQVHGAPAATT